LWRTFITPVPGLIGDPRPGILGVREDEAEASGIIEKPLIFGQGLEFGVIFLAIDALRANEIDCQMLGVPVLAVARQCDPFRRLADRIIMIAEIIDKKVKLVGARAVPRFDKKPPSGISFHCAHHELKRFIDRTAQELRRDLFFFSLHPDLLPVQPHQIFFSLREPAEWDRNAGLLRLDVAE
jgi:hypothetical protein